MLESTQKNRTVVSRKTRRQEKKEKTRTSFRERLSASLPAHTDLYSDRVHDHPFLTPRLPLHISLPEMRGNHPAPPNHTRAIIHVIVIHIPVMLQASPFFAAVTAVVRPMIRRLLMIVHRPPSTGSFSARPTPIAVEAAVGRDVPARAGQHLPEKMP